MANVRGVLVKVTGDGRGFASAAAHAFGAGSLEIEPILHVPAKANGKGFAGESGASWLRVRRPGAGPSNPWDLAHDLLAPGQAFSAAVQGTVQAIEPDIEQAWLFREPDVGTGFAASSKAELCAFDAQDPRGGKATGRTPDRMLRMLG